MDKEQLELIVKKIGEGIPQGRIQLGGTERNSTAAWAGSTYVEGTSIPTGRSGINALFNAAGEPVRNIEDADLSKGAIVHKERAQGGESYVHNLYFISPEGSVKEIIRMSDPAGKMVCESENHWNERDFVQQWYSFAHKSNSQKILRRHKKNKFIDDYTINPFNLKYDGGFPNPSVPMQNGLIYHNTKTGDTLKIEKVKELDDKNFFSGDSKINIKLDTLELNGDKILEVGGNIDIVNTKGKDLYIVESEMIDFFYPENGALKIFTKANPTNLEDRLLTGEYTEASYQAGPQMRHSVYKLNLDDKNLSEIYKVTDGSHKGYEHTFQPTTNGIKAISRDSKKEIDFSF